MFVLGHWLICGVRWKRSIDLPVITRAVRMADWKLTQALKDKISYFALLFHRYSPAFLCDKWSCLVWELPIRLAHQVKEMNELPNYLNKMPSILKVRDWWHNALRPA
ncbi:pyruvate dehydrogenase kinase [Puccinia sorghi]|uniref:Pyruvate dehydrogenase kinase n=1 Tax=Puccinia sorghi TaxID=27349 RepID=A0A0L6V1B1_9BASI|nr:pyruvate dehydrogenase kinase [Puccinia sorghi]